MSGRRRFRWAARVGCCAAALIAGAAVFVPAAAQTLGAGDQTVYAAGFFRPFQPATALQMVERVPGFTIVDPVEDAGGDLRGFSQAAGNVVINGARPSSKDDTLRTVLARIPASRVARIEVAAGNLFGADYVSRAQVVNVVLSQAGGASGTVNGTVYRKYTGALRPEGSVAGLLRRGPSTFNALLAVANDDTGEEGGDTVRSMPSGAITEYRRKINNLHNPAYTASAGWAFDGGENRVAHLNARYGVTNNSLVQTNDIYPAVGPFRDDLFDTIVHRKSLELSGDATRPLLGGGLQVVGLATRRRRNEYDDNIMRVRSAVTGGSIQLVHDQRDETLGRLVWRRKDVAGWSVELGGEGALNRLESHVDLFALRGGGARVRTDLPLDDAVVQERRGEVFANLGHAWTPRLRMDAGLRYELSNQTVRGDAIADRRLHYIKPSLAFDWRASDRWRAQLSVKRTVAQLNFEDFISTAELSNDRVNGGNANLAPQRAWEVLATVERRIADGLVKLELGRDRISLLQDRVPTPEGFDAPGNLGAGIRRLARLQADLPLTRLGMKGGRLSGRFTWQDTAVRDPYTLRKRHFSNVSTWVSEVNLRQDLGRYAWGVTGAWTSNDRTVFRRNELDRYYSGPSVQAFAEYRSSPRTTVRLAVNNLADLTNGRDRTFFTPDRRNPVPSSTELRARQIHLVPSLSLKHNLG